jgi:CAAX prenyl protease-like protein
MNISEATSNPPRLGVAGSLAMYGCGAALLYVTTRFLIPFIVHHTHVEPIVAWFIGAGAAVFFPLITIAVLLLLAEGRRGVIAVERRLWLRRMTLADWGWTVAGSVAIVVLSAPVIAVLVHKYGESSFTPDFLSFDPLASGRCWILAAWLPFFGLNMLGEAFVWHSVMLPRQVQSFGSSAWFISGLGWGFFHLALPWQILLSLAPTLFIIPYVVQRRANTWIGVVLHALVNAPGFLAVVLGGTHLT